MQCLPYHTYSDEILKKAPMIEAMQNSDDMGLKDHKDPFSICTDNVNKEIFSKSRHPLDFKKMEERH